MRQELQQQLFEKYPKIFAQKDLPMSQTAMCWGIACGDGWYNIIDVLCLKIQQKIDRPHETIQYIDENIDSEENSNRQEFFENWRATEEKSIIEQVEAVQVKEKYGSLRFYVNVSGGTISNWISFAETMSSVTCETCGKPGTQNTSGWIKTLCGPCREAQEQARRDFITDAKQLKIKFEE